MRDLARDFCGACFLQALPEIHARLSRTSAITCDSLDALEQASWDVSKTQSRNVLILGSKWVGGRVTLNHDVPDRNGSALRLDLKTAARERAAMTQKLYRKTGGANVECGVQIWSLRKTVRRMIRRATKGMPMNATTGATRFFIYARKSTDDETRQLRSIGDQLAEIAEFVQREKLLVVGQYIERESARKPGRPEFEKMLRKIEQGEANGIIAWAPDRISRNAFDAGRVLQLVETGEIKELKFPNFRFEPDAQGKFSLMMAFGQSQYFVHSLSEHILRGRNRKIKDGGWPQIAPVGYVNNPKTRGVDFHP